MKTIFIVSFKIWIRTILMNGALLGLAVPLGIAFRNFLIAIFAPITAFFLTFPLLILIMPILKISIRLPYNSSTRIFCLWFYLELVIVLFYILFYKAIHSIFDSKDDVFYLLASTTSLGLVLAILWTKKSIKTLIEDKQ